jgi:hypothetical protein
MRLIAGLLVSDVKNGSEVTHVADIAQDR